MANGRNKLRRGDAGRDAGGFVALPWVVLDSPAYAQLSMHARALLLCTSSAHQPNLVETLGEP